MLMLAAVSRSARRMALTDVLTEAAFAAATLAVSRPRKPCVNFGGCVIFG
jgi:hypothetical protein